MSVTTSPLNALESRLQGRLEVVQRIKDLVVEDPVLLDELVVALQQSAVNPKARSSSNGSVKPTRFTVLRDVLRSAKNDWRSVAQLERITEFPADSIRYVLYKSHRQHFENACAPGSGRDKVWRLVNPEGGD